VLGAKHEVEVGRVRLLHATPYMVLLRLVRLSMATILGPIVTVLLLRRDLDSQNVTIVGRYLLPGNSSPRVFVQRLLHRESTKLILRQARKYKARLRPRRDCQCNAIKMATQHSSCVSLARSQDCRAGD
jgi:hypothetical protein